MQVTELKLRICGTGKTVIWQHHISYATSMSISSYIDIYINTHVNVHVCVCECILTFSFFPSLTMCIYIEHYLCVPALAISGWPVPHPPHAPQTDNISLALPSDQTKDNSSGSNSCLRSKIPKGLTSLSFICQGDKLVLHYPKLFVLPRGTYKSSHFLGQVWVKFTNVKARSAQLTSIYLSTVPDIFLLFPDTGLSPFKQVPEPSLHFLAFIGLTYLLYSSLF